MTEDKPDFIRVAPAQWQILRKCYRDLGPRHRNADRWLYELGWTFAPGVLEKYLAAEAS